MQGWSSVNWKQRVHFFLLGELSINNRALNMIAACGYNQTRSHWNQAMTFRSFSGYEDDHRSECTTNEKEEVERVLIKIEDKTKQNKGKGMQRLMSVCANQLDFMASFPTRDFSQLMYGHGWLVTVHYGLRYVGNRESACPDMGPQSLVQLWLGRSNTAWPRSIIYPSWLPPHKLGVINFALHYIKIINNCKNNYNCLLF